MQARGTKPATARDTHHRERRMGGGTTRRGPAARRGRAKLVVAGGQGPSRGHDRSSGILAFPDTVTERNKKRVGEGSLTHRIIILHNSVIRQCRF